MLGADEERISETQQHQFAQFGGGWPAALIAQGLASALMLWTAAQQREEQASLLLSLYAAITLILGIADDRGPRAITLGPDLAAGHSPQGIVPPHAWQAASTTGDWTLVGCTVAPGFDFATFELAPKGWTP